MGRYCPKEVFKDGDSIALFDGRKMSAKTGKKLYLSANEPCNSIIYVCFEHLKVITCLVDVQIECMSGKPNTASVVWQSIGSNQPHSPILLREILSVMIAKEGRRSTALQP